VCNSWENRSKRREEDSGELPQFLAIHSKHLDQEFDRALASQPVDVPKRREIQANSRRHGGFCAMIGDRIKTLSQETTVVEMRQLEEKMNLITAGKYTKGDLSKRGRCMAYAAGAGLAAGLGHWMFVFAALAAMSTEGRF
jgi:hypothetical protein